MNSILQAMVTSFSPQIAIALISGLIGGLIGAKDRKKQYGKGITFLLLLASIIDAGAVADYMTTSHAVVSLFISMALGVVVGIVSGHLMDMLSVASPRLSSKLINRTGDAAVDTAVKRIEDIGSLIGGKSHNKQPKDTSHE